MFSRTSLTVIAVFSVMTFATPTLALDLEAPPMTVKAGSTVRIYGVFDCIRNVAPSVGGIADHGTITTREGTTNRCGNQKQPVTELYYTPPPGYRGPDEVRIRRGGAFTAMKITVQ